MLGLEPRSGGRIREVRLNAGAPRARVQYVRAKWCWSVRQRTHKPALRAPMNVFVYAGALTKTLPKINLMVSLDQARNSAFTHFTQKETL